MDNLGVAAVMAGCFFLIVGIAITGMMAKLLSLIFKRQDDPNFHKKVFWISWVVLFILSFICRNPLIDLFFLFVNLV
jgi:hypothetical protein